MKRYNKMLVVKSQAEHELEKEALRKIEAKIYKEIPLPPEPQKRIDDFIPKDTEYWHRYNQAKTNEKRMFYLLLDDLLNVITEPPHDNGRPPVPVRDLLFCSCIKSYNNFSARRISSDLQHAKNMGFVKVLPHYNTLLAFMNNSFLSDLLNQLITITALPLKSVETDFALDSSGFGSYQYERWIRVRFQRALEKEYSKRNYVKAHIAIGTTTQIITAVEITPGNYSDTKQLPYLVNKTHENFEPKRWTADKGYSSRKNMQLIGSLEAVPFIAFKNNSTGTSKGCPIWNAMFTYFQMYREQYDKFYHRRSLIESTFSIIKRKYGEFLRSKNFEAQKNEVLLKCLCHNISQLVEEVYQNGINIKFKPLTTS
jgi:transposase